MAFKLHTIGGFKAVKNDPTTVADVALIQGQPVILDKQAGKSKLPVLAEAKGKELHVVANIDDQPSLFAKEDVAVAKDSHVRAFRLADLQGLEVELGGKALADEARAKGDKLVADITGVWKKAADVTGYALYLEVTAINTLAGKGVVAIVRVA
ncbi:hypothetical protein [Exiguobacterium sp. s78]|uniref:hypothetical protein n=1 Tax=Exiguobacterium sp. s78 TaxID=2751197 RepID=UPI001BEC2417|nr:hypothetical protein [Exiguobacterium sp. s78]